MSANYKLSASKRDRAGKGASRALRRAQLVPAVIYGDKKSPELVTVTFRDASMLYNTGSMMSNLIDLDVDGKVERVIPRDVQLDPVRDFVMHIDFLRLGKGATVAVNVPVHFINEEESEGLKRGGVINVVRHEVELNCPADSIPESLEIDLTGTDIGDSIHISAIKLGKGVTPVISDRDFTVATIAAPAGLTSAEDEASEEGEAAAADATPEAEEGGEG